MNIKTARIICLVLSSALFSALLFFKPNIHTCIEPETPLAEIVTEAESEPMKIGIKFAEHKKTEAFSATVEKAPEIQDTAKEQILTEEQTADTKALQYIDTYIDLDTSENSDLVRPVIDMKKIYSRIVYPSSMRRKNIETSFQVRVFIDKLGNVTITIPPNVDSSFRQAVQNAFKKIKAQPATLNDKPIDVSFTIPIQFSLY